MGRVTAQPPSVFNINELLKYPDIENHYSIIVQFFSNSSLAWKKVDSYRSNFRASLLVFFYYFFKPPFMCCILVFCTLEPDPQQIEFCSLLYNKEELLEKIELMSRDGLRFFDLKYKFIVYIYVDVGI